MESRQYTRHLSLSELKWFAIGIGFFILSIATATVNYRLFRYIATGGPVVYHLEI